MAKSELEIKHCVIYSIIFCIYSFSFIYDAYVSSDISQRLPEFEKYTFGGRLKYLTFIDSVCLDLFLVPQNSFPFLCLYGLVMNEKN